MVPRRYRQPPPVYPYGRGFVAPVQPLQTPWLHPQQDIPLLPHQTPNAQVPPVLPPDPNSPSGWENPFNQPVIPPSLAQTPIFPLAGGTPYENAVVQDTLTPFFTPWTPGGHAPLPMMTPGGAAFTPLPGMSPGGVNNGFGFSPRPGMTPFMPGTIPLGPGHYAHSPGGQSWKPGTFPPQDPNMSVPLQLHPKLLYNPVNPGLPVLEWDLALSPPTALSVTGRHCYVKPDLKASAVSPDVQTIHIESDEPLLQGWMQRWGPIIVNNDDKVTMGDVMWAIYDYLQKPLTNEDKELIKERDRNSAEGTSDWHSLEYARHIRCQEGYGLYRVASQEDFKRVDALGGLRRFKGLRFVVFGTNQWKAYLGLLEGPLYVVKPA